MRERRLLSQLLTYLAVLVLVVVTLAPLVWLFIMSISSATDLTARPLHWLPDEVDLSRYVRLVVEELEAMVREAVTSRLKR